MSNYEKLKNFVQWISFFSSLFFNSILIVLIMTKSPKKMGNYRYLMIYFSGFAMFFSTLDVVVGPGRTAYFEGGYLIIWLAIPILCGVIWGATLQIFVAPTEETTEFLRASFLLHYNLDMKYVIYIGSSYWKTNSKGEMEVVVSSYIAVTIFFLIKATSFGIVSYYGYLSYRRISHLPKEGESVFTRSLQKQLYTALVFQAIIPILLMYLPIGSFLILPAFNVNIESFSKLATLFYAVYPAVDPLPLFFVVDNYRIALRSCFYGCTVKANRVSVTEDTS
ncbi:hypothetical protein CAEBREN_19825 [Caenorhabditis brenneri]|uniref:Seven TM Receptor n=1 Tax=Caenorhabditis brenneri TaxID=135651 RepID=G0MRR2_CAEBE|nr:hypothetical protein CAEBREN_19825 [Caenorhabditis brenneri]